MVVLSAGRGVFLASGYRPASLKKYGRSHGITQVSASSRPGPLSQLDDWYGQPVGKSGRASLRTGKIVRGPDQPMVGELN